MLAVQADDPESVARALIQQVHLHVRAGQLESASTLAGFVRAYVPDGRLGPELEIRRDVTLGYLAQNRREYDESQLLFERALARGTDLYGTEHPYLARIHNMLGNLWSDRDGAADEAAMHYGRALELYRRYYGEHHPLVASALNNLAIFHARRSELTTALSEFEASLAIDEDIFGENSSRLLPPLMNIAVVMGVLGRYEDGLRLEERAARLAETNSPAEHPMLATIYYERSRFHFYVGHRELAVDDMRRALTAHERTFGPTHPETIMVMAALAMQLRAIGQLDEAERLDQLAYAHFERELPEDASVLHLVLDHLARIDFEHGRFEQALAHAEQHVVHLREIYGPGTQDVAVAQIMVMRALLALDRPADALHIGEQALGDLDEGAPATGLWPIHQLMGRAELALGHEDRALAALERAASALQREQGLPFEREELTAELERLRTKVK